MKVTLLVCVAAAACAKTDSSDLLTSGIYAAISAQAKGDGTTDVYATLYVGNPINLNFVDLTGDDKLIASHGPQERKQMSETTLLNLVSHHAGFDVDDEGEQFEVAFQRTVDRGAPSSIATLPAKFAIDAPPTTASRAQPLSLSWGPVDAATPMRWQVSGDCIDTVSNNMFVDSGALTIPANMIVKKMGATVMDQCEITVQITRAKAGVIDPNYGKGGSVEGQQIRKVMLTSMP